MTDYQLLCAQAREILTEDPWYVTALSNLSALIWDALPELNWAGFYVLREGRLNVGPFQGKPACVHIEKGRGVCGTSLERNRTINVPNVHAFPGHIACDSASNSEIVVPLHRNGEPVGVMDIDSPIPGRFSPEDQKGLEMLAELISSLTDWEEHPLG